MIGALPFHARYCIGEIEDRCAAPQIERQHREVRKRTKQPDDRSICFLGISPSLRRSCYSIQTDNEVPTSIRCKIPTRTDIPITALLIALKLDEPNSE